MGKFYDGSLVFNTAIDPKGFEQGVEKMKALSKKGSLAVAASAAAIGAATIKIGKDSLGAYASYEQLIGGVETLFKESANSVINNAKKAFKTAGVSMNKYMETTTSFSASLLQSLGGDTQKAAEMADMALIDMSDNANKMGTDLTMIQNAYQGFAKQNYTMLDNLKLGFGGTKEEMQRLLIEAEKLSGVKYDISSFADIVDAIHVIQTEMGITGTTAKEATETIEGSFGMLKASWENLMIGLADSDQDLDKLIDDVISSAETVIKNVGPRIEEIFDSIVKGANKASPGLGTIVEILVDIGGFAFGVTAKGLSLVAKSIDLLTTAFIAFGAAYATYKIVTYLSGLSAAVKAYSVAVAAANATSTAGATVELLLAKSLKTSELAFGVLTGKVKLATAAQLLYNAAVKFLSGPGGIALAIGAIVALGIALHNASDDTNSASKRIDELSDKLKDLKKNHEDAIKSIEETSNETVAEAETAKVLRDRLYELDDQLKSNTLTEEEAISVREDFNTVASELNKIIPGITDNIYDETGAIDLQRSSIDSLTGSYYKLMVAKATADAYKEKLTQVASDLIDAKDIQTEAKDSMFTIAPESSADALFRFGPSPNLKAQGTFQLASKTIADLNTKQQKYLDGYTEALQEIENYTKLFQKPEDNPGGGGPGGGGITSKVKQEISEIKKEFEKRYKMLNRMLEREEISHSDYYKGLKYLRDEYFTEGSDEWEKYTEELQDFTEDTFDYCLEELEDYKQESIDKINEIKNEQEQLKEKLIPDKSPVEFGTIAGEAFISLANYDQEVNKLTLYNKMLDELFEKRSDLPQSIISELKDMDADKGMKYIDALLKSTDAQLDSFIKSRQKLDDLASKSSEKIMSSEMEELKRLLEEKFGELPEDFFALGTDSALSFGDAFLSQLGEEMKYIKDSILKEMDSIIGSANLKLSAVTADTGSNTTNNYTSSYTFNSSKDTTTEQLRTAQNAATLDRMRGVSGN